MNSDFTVHWKISITDFRGLARGRLLESEPVSKEDFIRSLTAYINSKVGYVPPGWKQQLEEIWEEDQRRRRVHRHITFIKTTMAWEGVISWLKADASIKAWLEEGDEEEDLKSLDVDVLREWQLALAYSGFDIKRIIRIMIQRSAIVPPKTESTEIKYNTAGVERIITYDNRKSLASDVKMLITLFCIRGNNIDRISTKSKEGVGKLTQILIEKYDIDVSKRQSLEAVDPDVITLPRICACFPLITCDVFASGAGKVLVTPNQLGITADNISPAILTPFFTSCIPQSFITVGAGNANLLFFLVHVFTDNVVHSKERNFTELQPMFDYYAAAYRSEGVPTNSRVAYCGNIGVATADKKSFTQSIIAAISGAEAIIRAERPDDKGLEVVLNNLKYLK